tara:strand:- start:1596 stop:1808 length:213 start_codon:yes stop_codon:yes gene_type:complete
MNKEHNKQDFIVTTANGTRWSATGTSAANVRENFFGSKIGLAIESIEKGKLFTDEESEQLRKEKIEESIR